MADIFAPLVAQLKANPKTIVFTEGNDPRILEAAAKLLAEAYESRDENFGNAREVRNLFEKLVSCQSDRIAAMESPTKEDLMLLTEADFDAAAGEPEAE